MEQVNDEQKEVEMGSKELRRDFKGVWIKKKIYLTRELTWTEKAALIEIDCLVKCREGDSYFSRFLGVPKKEVSVIIKRLEDLGFINVIGAKSERSITVTTKMADYNFDGEPIVSNEELEELDSETEIGEEMEVGVDDVVVSDIKMVSINQIYNYWNSFSQSKKWRHHTKLSKYIKQAILDVLNDATIDEVCDAIENYHTILNGEQYFWNYIWPLTTFLSVSYGGYKGATKKWMQFHPENFVKENYLTSNRNRGGNEPIEIDDQHPEITKKIIMTYGRLIGNKEFAPLPNQMGKFVDASVVMINFFSGREIKSENWISYLSTCLKKNYIQKGQPIKPGNLCNHHTWEILMPQLMKELGVD